jgi:hypothetical protein
VYIVIGVRVLAGSERNNTGEENKLGESTSEAKGALCLNFTFNKHIVLVFRSRNLGFDCD